MAPVAVCLGLRATYNRFMSQLTLELMRMPWPAEWSAVFGRQAPLTVEIGFGNGLFLLHEAQRQPERNFLGIEIASPSIRRAAGRIRSAGAENVRLVRASAQSALQLLCKPDSISEALINFPDPWPKEGHTGRRLISAPFLELLATRLVENAALEIATDHAEYGSQIAELLQASPHFESRLATAYLREDAERVRTKYEQKGLAAGSTCYYFKWRRNAAGAPDKYPVVEELAMPHVVAKCPLSIPEIAGHFEPHQCVEEQATIRFIEMYQSQRRPSLIIDTYIVEEPLDQRLMLEIYRRPDGDYLLRLLATGFPRPTAGVHAAVACLTRWLCGLHAESVVARHNLRVSPTAGD